MRTQNYQDYTYRNRNDILRELGYRSYSEYLSSDLWKEIRRRAIRKAKGMCEVCGKNEATHVHHLNYQKDTLLGKKETLVFLVASCEECHIRVEFDQNGNKRPFYETGPALIRVKTFIEKGIIKPSVTKITNQVPTRLWHISRKKKQKKHKNPQLP